MGWTVSWDAVFWRYRDRGLRRPPREVYRDLLDGMDLSDELTELTGDRYIANLRRLLPMGLWETNGPGGLFWTSEDEKASVEVSYSPWHVVAFCRGMSNDGKNLVIDAGLDLGACLYDPQTDERFDDRGQRLSEDAGCSVARSPGPARYLVTGATGPRRRGCARAPPFEPKPR